MIYRKSWHQQQQQSQRVHWTINAKLPDFTRELICGEWPDVLASCIEVKPARHILICRRLLHAG
jgi:hypothetical protein